MKFTVRECRSSLIPGESGGLRVHLMQLAGGSDVMGRRRGFVGVQERYPPTAEEIEVCKALLATTESGALNVVSFLPGMVACIPDLERLAATRTIVTLTGVHGEDRRNWTFIAKEGVVEQQAKLSLSSEDQQGSVKGGTELSFYSNSDGGSAVRWAVLNCHDYTNIKLLLPLLEKRVELIIVVAYNNATRLYWEYAIADMHRLFCYIVIVNVGEVGGSGIFAPFRHIGFDKNATYNAGGQIFGARGPAEISATFNLNFSELRRMRDEFLTRGFVAVDEKTSNVRGHTPAVPSEHYLSTFDRNAGAPPILGVTSTPTPWKSDIIRVAVAQLSSMSLDSYVTTKYRLRKHPSFGPFQTRLQMHLDELEERCKLMGPTQSGSFLHLLVFPEVFVPRSFAERHLDPLAERLGVTIVCGLDYPGNDEADNANECAILRPGHDPVYYRKVTRSQYDALADDERVRMPMRRGTTLHRFVNTDGHGFGVLICYDFSHLDLMVELNLRGRSYPLDVVIVVAHNPFGALYRTCCIADSHRFYQYIIMCNVAKYGGSGVYAPRRTEGARQTLIDLGKGAETISIASLDLAGLRAARLKNDIDLNAGEFMRRPGIFQR
jgi:predicted amidohydrolase